MTLTPPRPLLPLLSSGPHGSRSHLTCQYRCGNACDQPIPNQTGHPEFREVAARALARRSLLKGGAVAGAVTLAGLQSPAAARVRTSGAGSLGRAAVRGAGAGDFAPVAPNNRDEVTVPDGFVASVVIGWGDRVLRDAPAFDVHKQTPEAAAAQFGYNNDYVGVLPLRGDRALLVANHEYTDEQLMFPSGEYDDVTTKRISMASHGMSVVEVVRGSAPGSWQQADVASARHNRRVHTGTAFRLVGPATGDERLRTAADGRGRTVLGTLNNCAGGTTPWGTVLSGEENFNGYFDASGELDARYAESYARYGISGRGRGWSEVDDRFDLSVEPHEPFRFGWIVELDPSDPGSIPRKHTMLGRFKHEGANVTISASGHAVVYMGDDERGDYVYKFVSAGTYDPGRGARARRRNLDLLTAGTLHVARFTGDGAEDGEYDGTGEWIALCSDTESYVEGMSVADVLIDTRLAADKVAPTRMDRPEDVEPNHANAKVYLALTNNSQRGSRFPVDEPNPLATSMTRESLDAPLVQSSGNRNGYVLELTPAGDDHTATGFTWNLMLVCGDPSAPETYFAGFPKEQVSPISCPDNLAFDSLGNLWVSTDGNRLGSNDGLFRVPVTGPERGHVEQFLTVPIGAETCGPLLTDQDRTVWIAVQHPGEVDGASFENQASTWPHTHTFPRPSVVVVHEA